MTLQQAVAEATSILDRAILEYKPVAVISLFSGGNDSTVATHLARSWLTHAAHINTGIGIPSTTEYVRETCKAWGVPLIELVTPPEVYEGILFAKVKGDVIHGFPGPAAHNVCYWYLKERRIRELRRMFVPLYSRKHRVMYVTGIRSSESARRMRKASNTPIRREGSEVWVSPILHFDSRLMAEYRQQHELPQCEASALLHRSGECLCGAFAQAGELKEIEFWFPQVGARIRDLERRLREVSAYRCEWGVKKKPTKVLAVPGPLCAGCGK